MNNIDKIKILSAKINAVEIGLEWLISNNLDDPTLNVKTSRDKQISDLTAQKNALQQEVDRLNNI